MRSVFVRKNGWSLPLHPRQVSVWIFLVCMVVYYYGVFVHYLPFSWRIVGIIVGCLVLGSHVIAHVITVSIDPSDIHVRNKSDEATDYYCEICEVNVFENTKHCKTCNKCVAGIDHHCLWLNNCIGSHNYRPFFVTLVTGFVMVILFAVFGLVLFTLFFASPNKLCYTECSLSTNSSSEPNLKLFGAEVSGPVFVVITGIVTLPSWITGLLLGHLLAFHVYFSKCYYYCFSTSIVSSSRLNY